MNWFYFPSVVLILFVSVVVGCLRFTVPGHELTGVGAVLAFVEIAIGVLLVTVSTPIPSYDRYLTSYGMVCRAINVFVLAASLLGLTVITGPRITDWPVLYEISAHIWVGSLLVFCFRREPGDSSLKQSIKLEMGRWASITCLAVISLLELVMFLLRQPSWWCMNLVTLGFVIAVFAVPYLLSSVCCLGCGARFPYWPIWKKWKCRYCGR